MTLADALDDDPPGCDHRRAIIEMTTTKPPQRRWYCIECGSRFLDCPRPDAAMWADL